MAIQVINIGTSANKGDGEPLRTAFDKINDNFAELSLKVTNLETGGITVTTGDIKGSVFGDDSTLLVDGVNSKIPSANLSGALPAIDGSALTGVTTTETLASQWSTFIKKNFTKKSPPPGAPYGGSGGAEPPGKVKSHNGRWYSQKHRC